MSWRAHTLWVLLRELSVIQTSNDVIELLRARGDLAYDGEGVSQLQHGWQCAERARSANASPALQLACWLHDIGHLTSGLSGSPTLDGVDDRHEVTGSRLLQALFGTAVAQPVALHVLAKRYLVAQHPGYAQRLSADAQRSLQLQGGPLDGAACLAFEALPHAQDALRLRVWDEEAKRPHLHPASTDVALTALQDLMDRVKLS